jgi:leucyl aminopeptidase
MMLSTLPDLADQMSQLFLPANAKQETCPISLARMRNDALTITPEIDAGQRAWLSTLDFKAAPGAWAPLPGDIGLAGVVVGADDRQSPDSQPLFPGGLPSLLPKGDYHLAWEVGNADLAAIAWALGHYAFQHYQTGGTTEAKRVRLRLPEGAALDHVVTIAAATWLARDLINMPANDLGPAELEAAVRGVAAHFGAECSVIAGDDLISANFPLIHAVGRASARAPRLIDLRWGDESAPKVTLVGKGICFDTGGLDIKTRAGMALMKKDMGGAAATLALAAMIMGAKLPVRLRLLIAAAENAISSNAYRPGDVLTSRMGLTVEVGDTDAEGRLVLADALALADEEAPGDLLSFATLTGAARAALGPDLPPVYSTDGAVAARLADFGGEIGDPTWPMPLWQPYDALLDSRIGDVASIAPDPMAGSVMAALFLKRFVADAKIYTHFDIYGWVSRAQPAKPVGGEPQCARAAFEYFKGKFPKA